MAVKRAATPDQHVPSPKPARNASAASAAPRPAPVETPRNFAARGIAALLSPVLRPTFRRRAPAAAQLLADWPALAGAELAARAAPVKFAAGTLTLACTGPVAMELQLSAAAVIQRLNLGLGSPTVERLRFVQQAPGVVAAAPAAPRRRPHRAKRPENLPEGELGEALARLHASIRGRT